MKTTKWTGVLSVILLLAGCGQGAQNGQTGTGSKNIASEPAELVFYSRNKMPSAEFFESFGDPLQKKFPAYTIKYIQNDGAAQDLPNLMTAGQKIDIYFESIGQYMGGIVKYDMSMDMTDLIKKHNVDLTRFEPSTIDSMKQMFGGKLPALPVSNNTLVLFYNKEIFERFGVPFPKDGMTWENTLQLARQISRVEDGKSYVGFSLSLLHLARLNQYSLPFVDPATSRSAVNNDKWKALYEQAYVDTAKDSVFRNRLEKEKDKLLHLDAFIKGQDVAMFLYLANFNQVSPVPKWDIVSAPTLRDAPGIGGQSYPSYFSITSTSKYQDQAMEAIKYLISDEFQLDRAKKGNISSLKNDAVRKALSESEVLKGKNINALFVNKLAPIALKTDFDAQADTLVRKDPVNIGLGKIDVNSALRKAEEETNKYISAEMQK
jgi:multiple sugar transport system substrate-binding protein